jgi:DNA mismatch repair protein MutS2
MDDFAVKSQKTLEFDKIRSMLAAHAVSDGAKSEALEISPFDNPLEINIQIDETNAALGLMSRKGSPTFGGVKDLSPLLVRAGRGGVLSMAELLSVAAFLRAVRKVKDYRFRDDDKEQTCLDGYFGMLKPDREFEQSITDAILSESEIADSASAELSSIRKRIKAAENRIREVLSKIISSPNTQKILQEAIITQRFGRYVVPVKAECKNEMPGLMHDVSSSGATVFIEPMAVVEANNEISVLKSQEKNEIERILAEFSARVFEREELITLSYKMLTALDLIFARAKLALELDCFPPAINTDGVFELRRARHPLLDKKSAVPIDITLGKDFNTLIITGPNTGGKTVALKTLGLLTLMAQSGLHIPAAEGSRIPVCSGVYADIGDEQSIEQSLSTFSSHMENIVSILACADDKSLVLFDELGAGTDPIEGAALAIAIIEKASGLGAKIAATTHYAELKIYALNTNGVENASCEFDVETLRPTYRLLTGIPGRSNAFAISKRLGLDEAVIERARELVGSEAGKFEQVIDRLEKNRQQAEEEKRKITRLRLEIEELNKKIRERERQIEAERAKAAQTARAEANEIIEKTRREAAALIAEIREFAKRRDEDIAFGLNTVHAEVNRRLNELSASTPADEEKEDEAVSTQIQLTVGDEIFLKKMGVKGVVLSPPDYEGFLDVQAGILRVRVRLSEISAVAGEKKKAAKPAGGVSFSAATIKDAIAANRLDLRGMASDEAIIELSQFLDSAARQRLPAATIIHGKGTGKLREAVRDYLRTNKLVKSYRPGTFGEGEDGVTIVEF